MRPDVNGNELIPLPRSYTGVRSRHGLKALQPNLDVTPAIADGTVATPSNRKGLDPRLLQPPPGGGPGGVQNLCQGFETHQAAAVQGGCTDCR